MSSAQRLLCQTNHPLPTDAVKQLARWRTAALYIVCLRHDGEDICDRPGCATEAR